MPVFTAIGSAILTSIGFTVAAAGASAAGFAIVTGTTAMIVGVAATASFFGGIALSIIQSQRSADFGALSPSYGQGMKQTQTNQDLPIPLLYGTCKLAGNRIWQDEDYLTTIKRIVAFAEGEICEFTDIRLNDIPINEISGITVNKYYGTRDQVVDSIVGGANQEERAEKVGSLRDVAYLAISVPRSQKIDMNYNLTAVVKGRKVRVYTSSYSYEVKYSENPAWVMFDFLTSYNGLGLGINNYGNISDDLVSELFDLDSFVEAAEFCDELVDGKPRFTFNMIFDSQTSARTLIDEIYRSCRGGLFIKNGKLQFKIDKPEPVSKVFTQNDILKGSETFETLPKEEHYDILKCEYISPDHEWQKVEAFAEIPEYRDGVPVEHSVNIYSCTNFAQASRLAWYYVNSKILQPYFGSFKTDYRAYDLEVGDVIMFDSLLMGLERYKAKVVSVKDDGAGVFSVEWRTYDERLYSDELGSKEPRVLVSNLGDLYGYPDDVVNFNVVQTNNLFNFVWQYNKCATDMYEIRMGESWENGTILASRITQNSASILIPTAGLYKFWIKAFNGYNYSKNPTMDIISVDSVPNLNEIVKIDVLKDLDGVFSEHMKSYHNTLLLKKNTDVVWHRLDQKWSKEPGYYQTAGKWGSTVFENGEYESQVFDIGGVLKSVVTFDYDFLSADEQNTVVIKWAYSDDGQNWTEWSIVNNGTYTFRYCKFLITIHSYNNVQTILTNFKVSVDVPDKEVVQELEIIETSGLLVDYDFINPPSIVCTVNDAIDAYVVVAEKTNKSALLKAYKNSGELTTCKISFRAKGY